ncbi:MAG: hypothetical protein LJE94_18485 [Deltaproteobacteria bacterium]|nr:hypothetical protein [Deltaproteobacteria bacterium]
MAEIKSTLDLVMERTRHLSMSPEEQAAQRAHDFEKRLQGLLQKYSDDAVSFDEFREKLAALQNDQQVDGCQALLEALGSWIDPAGDNARWLRIVEFLNPPALAGLKAVLAAYREKRDVLLEETGRKRLDDLFNGQGIRGSAVVPNPAADNAYRDSLAALTRETLRGMEKALQGTG